MLVHGRTSVEQISVIDKLQKQVAIKNMTIFDIVNFLRMHSLR